MPRVCSARTLGQVRLVARFGVAAVQCREPPWWRRHRCVRRCKGGTKMDKDGQRWTKLKWIVPETMLYQTMPVHTMPYQVAKRTSFWASGMNDSGKKPCYTKLCQSIASPYHAIPGWEAHIFLGDLSAQVGSEMVGRASQEGQDQTPPGVRKIVASQRPQSHYILTLYLHYIYLHYIYIIYTYITVYIYTYI